MVHLSTWPMALQPFSVHYEIFPPMENHERAVWQSRWMFINRSLIIIMVLFITTASYTLSGWEGTSIHNRLETRKLWSYSEQNISLPQIQTEEDCQPMQSKVWSNNHYYMLIDTIFIVKKMHWPENNLCCCINFLACIECDLILSHTGKTCTDI